MASRENVRTLVDAAAARFGGLDVLHNHASVHESDLTPDISLDNLSDEVFERVYQINLRGPCWPSSTPLLTFAALRVTRRSSMLARRGADPGTPA